jgi:hypothetical protein
MGDAPREADARQGGCAYCRWIDVQGKRWRCRHPSYPMPMDWGDARDDDARCGHKGRLWEPVDGPTAPAVRA